MLKDGEKGAVLQADRTTFGVAPGLPCGVVSPDMLRRIADAAEKYGAKCVKITSANRIALLGIAEKDIDALWADLGASPGHLVGLCVRSVRCCPGTNYCRMGQVDSMTMGKKLDEIYHGMELPNKFKIAVSGCPINCAEGWVRDVGLFGRDKKWALTAGGNLGSRPRLGNEVISGLDDDEALQAVAAAVQFYKDHAKRGHRLGRTIEDLGVEPLIEAVKQALGR
jgi:NAD(P)H-nitrite reductase large subunit